MTTLVSRLSVEVDGRDDWVISADPRRNPKAAPIRNHFADCMSSSALGQGEPRRTFAPAASASKGTTGPFSAHLPHVPDMIRSGEGAASRVHGPGTCNHC